VIVRALCAATKFRDRVNVKARRHAAAWSKSRYAMSNGALSLFDYPTEKVIIECRRCEKRGRFDKAALIERVGPDEALPTLRLRLAAGLGCPVAQATTEGGFQVAQCGAHYLELLIKH